MQHLRFGAEVDALSGAVMRRARRTDFTAIMHLLADSGVPVPPADRATLRRFRNIVNDLGSDLYLCLIDDTLAGLVHLNYARQLCETATARIELLTAVGPHALLVTTALIELAKARARKHGCRRLEHVSPAPILADVDGGDA